MDSDVIAGTPEWLGSELLWFQPAARRDLEPSKRSLLAGQPTQQQSEKSLLVGLKADLRIGSGVSNGG